jgi:hypothetical protein
MELWLRKSVVCVALNSYFVVRPYVCARKLQNLQRKCFFSHAVIFSKFFAKRGGGDSLENVRQVDNRDVDWNCVPGNGFNPRVSAKERAGDQADPNAPCPEEYEDESYISPPPPPPSGDNMYNGPPPNADPNASEPLRDDQGILIPDPPPPPDQTLDPNITSANNINDAIAKFRAAADEASIQSLTTATDVTRINGIDNAVKKINPA